MNNKLLWLFRFLLGSIFILSAFSKLFPIEAFELTIVNQGITNWDLAPYLSRFMISVELFLGISFFITPFVKKIAIPFSFVLLIIFCIHLIYLISTGSGSKNCGCFGELIPMSSLAALIKNFILIFLLFLLYKYFSFEKQLVYSLAFAAYTIVFALVFIIFQIEPYNVPPENEAAVQPSDSFKSPIASLTNDEVDTIKIENESLKNTQGDKIQKTILPKTVSIFASFNEFSGKQTVNLDEGIKLVCLFSLDCEDCMETAHKLGQAKKDWNQFPPLYILFLGQEDQVKEFFEGAATAFPHKIIPSQAFFPLIKNYPPRVVLMNNGIIIGDWGYENFSVGELKTKLQY